MAARAAGEAAMSFGATYKAATEIAGVVAAAHMSRNGLSEQSLILTPSAASRELAEAIWSERDDTVVKVTERFTVARFDFELALEKMFAYLNSDASDDLSKCELQRHIGKAKVAKQYMARMDLDNDSLVTMEEFKAFFKAELALRIDGMMTQISTAEVMTSPKSTAFNQTKKIELREAGYELEDDIVAEALEAFHIPACMEEVDNSILICSGGLWQNSLWLTSSQAYLTRNGHWGLSTRQSKLRPPPAWKKKLDYHPGVMCHQCGMMPLVGVRYKRVDANYDLCETHYNLLQPAQQGNFLSIKTYDPDVAHCSIHAQTEEGHLKSLDKKLGWSAGSRYEDFYSYPIFWNRFDQNSIQRLQEPETMFTEDGENQDGDGIVQGLSGGRVMQMNSNGFNAMLPRDDPFFQALVKFRDEIKAHYGDHECMGDMSWGMKTVLEDASWTLRDAVEGIRPEIDFRSPIDHARIHKLLNVLHKVFLPLVNPRSHNYQSHEIIETAVKIGREVGFSLKRLIDSRTSRNVEGLPLHPDSKEQIAGNSYLASVDGKHAYSTAMYTDCETSFAMIASAVAQRQLDSLGSLHAAINVVDTEVDEADLHSLGVHHASLRDGGWHGEDDTDALSCQEKRDAIKAASKTSRGLLKSILKDLSNDREEVMQAWDNDKVHRGYGSMLIRRKRREEVLRSEGRLDADELDLPALPEAKRLSIEEKRMFLKEGVRAWEEDTYTNLTMKYQVDVLLSQVSKMREKLKDEAGEALIPVDFLQATLEPFQALVRRYENAASFAGKAGIAAMKNLLQAAQKPGVWSENTDESQEDDKIVRLLHAAVQSIAVGTLAAVSELGA